MAYRTVLVAVIAVMAIAGQASAVNWILNPSFEDPLGAEWVFTANGPGFTVMDRTTASPRTGDYGLQLQCGDALVVGYFSQLVTGLTPGASYEASVYLKHRLYTRADKYWVYIEALGGGAPVQSPAIGANTSSWTRQAVIQTADALGQIEVRLALDKYAGSVNNKTPCGDFDDVSLEEVVIPEPGSMIALLSGLVGLGVVARRRR